MGNKTPDLNKIGFRKERNVQTSYTARYTDSRRVGFKGTVATPLAIPVDQCLQWDHINGDLDIPEPLLKQEGSNGIGDGRNTARVTKMGHDVVEQALTIDAQTGIWLYYAMGAVLTDGTDNSPAITDASITRDSAVIVGGFSGLSVDTHIGQILRVIDGTYAGWVWTIIDNDASTVTLNTTTPADLATSLEAGSPSVEILKAPFTHTISEPSTTATQVTSGSVVYLPTFNIHIETSSGIRPKYRDLIGCIVKSLKITMEKGAATVYEVTVMVPKSMVGLLQTTYPTYSLSGESAYSALPERLTDEYFTWEHLDRTTLSYFKYGSTNIFGSTANWLDETSKIELTIENEIEINPVLGDDYANKYLVGKREYTVLMTYYPNSNEMASDVNAAYNLLYDLKAVGLASYTGNISLCLHWGRSETDYVKALLSSLYITEYPDKLIGIETREVSIDITLLNAPKSTHVTAGTFVGTVMDDRNTSYYGDT